MADTTRTHTDWIGRTVHDATGEKVGDITDVYYDERTGRPEWITVSAGWFGSKERFVPIAGSSAHGGDIRISFTKDQVTDAPGIDTGATRISEAEEARLYRHYGFDPDAADVDAIYGEHTRADEGFEYHERSQTPTDASTTRSEEELAIDKTERPAGRARLHKYVVTEDVNVTVPVKKQVARLVREPVSGETGGRVTVGGEDQVVTLTEEEVDVHKRTVAKERVGIEVDEVTEDRHVDETLRKEQVEVDGDYADSGRRR